MIPFFVVYNLSLKKKNTIFPLIISSFHHPISISQKSKWRVHHQNNKLIPSKKKPPKSPGNYFRLFVLYIGRDTTSGVGAASSSSSSSSSLVSNARVKRELARMPNTYRDERDKRDALFSLR